MSTSDWKQITVCGCTVKGDGSQAHPHTIVYCPKHKAARELLDALKDIIAECPNPTLPYGVRVVELARAAIAKADQT